MKSFKEFWSSAIGDVPPLGWLLRAEFPKRWFRIHTLPEAQRYAETEAEQAEVLLRQRSVSDEILGDQEPCWVVVPTYEPDERQTMRVDEVPGLDLSRVEARLIDETTFTFWAARVPWRLQMFEAALRAIAEDRLHALWTSEEGEVFAPYDGGIDIIARSAQRRAELMIRFAPWRSRCPGGL